MRMVLAVLLFLSWLAVGHADTTPADKAKSIHDCAGLLAPGNVYSLTITVTVDTTKGGPEFSARTDLDTSKAPSMRAERSAAEFQDCTNQFVSG
ncbi:MAG TPA: hypothetical protein VFL14_15180 [Xanthomonadales bacterium]|nr:hypothetical protein [Xanthomonadales bacterium]